MATDRFANDMKKRDILGFDYYSLNMYLLIG